MKDSSKKYHDYLNGRKTTEGEWSAEDQEMLDFLDQAEKLRPAVFSDSGSRLWDNIEKQIVEEEISSDQNTKKPAWLAIAAAITLLIAGAITVFYMLDQSAQIQYTAGTAENTSVQLPDGSQAFLNAESNLLFAEDWDRTLELQGEAFFEVVKGEKFTVKTALGDVTVLGTSFNVLSRKDLFSVSCKTGKVRVSFAGINQPEVFLTTGQTVLLDKGRVIKSKTDVKRIASWQTGEFYYESRPLSEVFDDLRRHYDMKVVLSEKSIADRLYQGYFYKGDLNAALSLICDPMGLDFKIKEREIVIGLKD